MQLATFFQVKHYDEKLVETRLETLAGDIRREIKQSIIDKQKATTAIAVSLSNELSKYDVLDQRIEIDKDFDSLVEKIQEHSDYKNLWVQIVNKDGYSLYRSWSTIRNSLAKIRPEFEIITKTQEPVQSISSGVFDVSIKVVTPIIRKSELVGFLDLISHFNSIQYRLENQRVDSLVIATKARSKILKYPFSQNKIGEFYVSNLHPNPVLVRKMDQTLLEDWNQREDSHWLWRNRLVVKYPLMTTHNHIHGYFYAFKIINNVSFETDEPSNLVAIRDRIIMFDMTLSIMVLMGMALLLMRRQKQYYQDILNYEEEAVLVTNGEELIDANTQLFTYFPELLNSNKRCICEFFEEAEGYLQKYMQDELWIHYLIKHPSKNHKALVMVDDAKRIFHVRARCIDTKNSLYVVVLSDVTEFEKLNNKLYAQSRMDELTQVSNRLHFNEVFEREISLAVRHTRALSLISFDIDHFKKVNDTYGHVVGDEVLKLVVHSAQKSLRASDMLFRVGGEEFIILLSNQNRIEAELVAEKVRLQIESIAEETLPKVTVSLGVTQVIENDDQTSLLVRIDKALYRAKEQGRNRVEVI